MPSPALPDATPQEVSFLPLEKNEQFPREYRKNSREREVTSSKDVWESFIGFPEVYKEVESILLVENSGRTVQVKNEA